jgi:hypothetical protein
LLATCCVDGGNSADAPTTARRQLHQTFFVPNQPGQPTAPPPFFPAMVVLGLSSKLVPAILLPLLTVVVLGLSVAFFFSHRRSNAARGGGGGCVGDDGDAKFLHPERTSLFACDEFGGGPTMAPTTSAEFLYVGTLASRADERSSDTTSSGDEESRSSGGSPELRPLPPLAHQRPPAPSRSPGGASPSSGEEEFYLPRGSSTKETSSCTAAHTPRLSAAANARQMGPAAALGAWLSICYPRCDGDKKTTTDGVCARGQ